MTGRPTSLTPEVQAIIIEHVRNGNYRYVAAQAAGVDSRTLLNWETWGREGKAAYIEFFRALEKAEAECETELLAAVKAGKGVWQTKAWMLERRYAQRWAARVKSHVAEEVDSLERKIREKSPELAAKVVDVITREGPVQAGDHAH